MCTLGKLYLLLAANERTKFALEYISHVGDTDGGAQPEKRARGLWGMTARSSAAVSPSPSASGQADEQAVQQANRKGGTGEGGQIGPAAEASSSGIGGLSMSEAADRFQVRPFALRPTCVTTSHGQGASHGAQSKRHPLYSPPNDPAMAQHSAHATHPTDGLQQQRRQLV